jgi:hypothetical protein
MKSTGRKTVKVDRTSAPLRKTSKTAKTRSKTSDMAEAKIVTMAETMTTVAGQEGAMMSVATSRMPTHEEIAKRSYEIFLARGGHQGFGSAEQDWLQAERELAG